MFVKSFLHHQYKERKHGSIINNVFCSELILFTLKIRAHVGILNIQF